VDAWEVCEALGENLMNADVEGDEAHYFLPNHVDFLTERMSVWTEFEHVESVKITSDIITDETLDFETRYGSEVAELKLKYGDENVEIVWGIVPYSI
jgi:hypothetical protein